MIFVMRGPLRRLVGFKKEVRIDASTLPEGLRALCLEYPDLQRVLLDASGQLRGVHRVALNRTVLGGSEMQTFVGADDVVDVLTALAGG